jgi:hypothetical protein
MKKGISPTLLTAASGTHFTWILPLTPHTCLVRNTAASALTGCLFSGLMLPNPCPPPSIEISLCSTPHPSKCFRHDLRLPIRDVGIRCAVDQQRRWVRAGHIVERAVALEPATVGIWIAACHFFRPDPLLPAIQVIAGARRRPVRFRNRSIADRRELRAKWRALETGLQSLLNGHEEGNLGYSQGGAYGPPRQFPQK